MARKARLMKDLEIRSSRVRDAQAIGQVLERAYSQLLAPDYDASLLQRVLPIMARPRPELLNAPGYLVALSGGRIVAVGGWSRANPSDGATAAQVGHVRHVACDPDVLRRGVARALLETVIAQARAAGIGLLCCLSTRTAVPFYANLGFRGDGEIDVRLQPGLLFPAVEMRLVLK